MGYKKGEILRTAFDSYTVEKQIGAGGSGEVYEVRDSDGSSHAAKVLDAAKASATRLKRFRNEISFCSKNTHPNIILVQGSGVTSNGSSFYVMPLYPQTLRNLMTRGIAPTAVLSYFGQLLDGVEAAHLLSVWHRDAKPENILYSPSGDSLVVADFGIAHFEEEELLTAVETHDNERLANFLYSAPEQRVRGQKVDGRADVYALALILNEMFTGAVPQGTNFRRIAEVSANHAYLDGLVDGMMRQDPASRPSIPEVKTQLIARGNDFLSLQRLSAQRNRIIPETEVDDPFVRAPIAIQSVDYLGGQFVFQLNSVPPRNWIMAFQDPRASSWGSYPGAGPGFFSFAGDKAYVTVPSGSSPQQLVDYAKAYVDMANRQYTERVTAEHRKRIEEQREQIRQGIKAEEERRRILENIRI